MVLRWASDCIYFFLSSLSKVSDMTAAKKTAGKPAKPHAKATAKPPAKKHAKPLTKLTIKVKTKLTAKVTGKCSSIGCCLFVTRVMTGKCSSIGCSIYLLNKLYLIENCRVMFTNYSLLLKSWYFI